MSKPHHVNAIVAHHPHGGWSAWLVFPQSLKDGQYLPIDTGYPALPTKESAMERFAALLEERSELMRRPVIEWKREGHNQRQSRIRTGEYLAKDNCEIRWFDHTKHFTHLDQGYLYEDGKRTDKGVTFYRYNEDGTARVWITHGIGECDVDPKNINPLNIQKPW